MREGLSSMKNNKTKVLAFCGICIALNMILGFVGASMKLPFYLDTIGTFLTAATFGPFYGAMVGGITNVVSALILGPKDIPFALVSIAIGLIVGFVSKKTKSYDLKTAIICGLVCGVVAPMIGTPIGVAVYGGLTGTVGDILFMALKQGGANIFAASFIPKLINNLMDKVLASLLVYFVIKKMPKQYQPNLEK